jgi:hypothetical protein
MLSGVAGIVMPEQVAAALELDAVSTRGVTEIRAGMGGTFAGLGGWALAHRSPAAHTAVGAVWLGAAGARLGSLAVDGRPREWTFWAYLAAEIGLGAIALLDR